MSNSKRTVKRLPGGLIAAFLVAFFVEIVLSHYSALWQFYAFNPFSNPAVRQRGRIYESRLYKNKIYILGDSQAFHDVDTDEINRYFQDSGLHFYNLGREMSDISDLALGLATIIKEKPKAVILPVSIHSFNHIINRRRAAYIFFTKPLILAFVNPEVVSNKTLLSILSPIQMLMDEMFVRLKYKRPLSTELFIEFLKRKIAGDNGNIKKEPSALKSGPQEYFEEMINDPKNRYCFSYNYATPYYEKLFSDYISALLKHNIKVIVVDTPQYPSSKVFYTDKDYEHYLSFLDNSQKKLNFFYLNGLSSYFSDEDFYTFLYFSGTGKKKLTDRLKAYLTPIFQVR